MRDAHLHSQRALDTKILLMVSQSQAGCLEFEIIWSTLVVLTTLFQLLNLFGPIFIHGWEKSVILHNFIVMNFAGFSVEQFLKIYPVVLYNLVKLCPYFYPMSKYQSKHFRYIPFKSTQNYFSTCEAIHSSHTLIKFHDNKDRETML